MEGPQKELAWEMVLDGCVWEVIASQQYGSTHALSLMSLFVPGVVGGIHRLQQRFRRHKIRWPFPKC